MESTKKVNILAWSDSPLTTSGFARVAREVLKSLHNTGKYRITSLGINYFGVVPQLEVQDQSEFAQSDRDIVDAYKNYMHYPANVNGDPLGRNVLFDLLGTGDYDILWILQDTFVVAPLTQKLIELKRQKGFKIVYYFPIDTQYVYKEFLYATRMADAVVTYNNWSTDVLRSAIGNEADDRIHTIYHGYSPQDYFEISEEERDAARKAVFGDKVDKNDIVILRSDSNQQRKDWNKTLQIVGAVAKNNPRVKFYANCDIKNSNFPLFAMAQACGLTPGVNFLFRQDFTKFRNMSYSFMNKMFNVADIGISTARGEGCGLFHYEMLSLGKVMVLSDNTAHTEAVEAKAALGIHSGKTVNGEKDESLLDIMDNDRGMMREVCNVEHGIKMLEKAIQIVSNKDRRIAQSALAKKFMEDKTWEKVGKEWVELFEKISEIIPSDVFIFKEKKGNAGNVNAKTDEYVKDLQRAISTVQYAFRAKYGEEPPKISFMSDPNAKPK